MMIGASTADSLYKELMWHLYTNARVEETRNGEVMTVPRPVVAALWNPMQRIVFSPSRDANPFFHVAETVWMFAGSNDVRFIEQFNKRYREYADTGTTHVWGAYGHRWIYRWGFDQIQQAIDLLIKNPVSRQVVINMWDPERDLTEAPHNDRPCNTQLMFRALEGGTLDMTVINRSNDLVWGMMGANIVHMTYVHELVARAAGLNIGTYYVVTNNLHMYTGMPRFQEIFEGGLHGTASGEQWFTVPILLPKETWADLNGDCYDYVDCGVMGNFRTNWFRNTAFPMMEAYLAGPSSERRNDMMLQIEDPGWRTACAQWVARR